MTQAIPANEFFVGVLSRLPLERWHTRMPCHSCLATWRSGRVSIIKSHRQSLLLLVLVSVMIVSFRCDRASHP